MDDVLARIVDDMMARVSGPMKFRLVLQPIMAAVLAVIAGLKDAKMGRPPYFWALFTQPAHRMEMIKDGWKQISRIFIFAVVMDVAYQYMVIRFVYPGEVIIVAIVLAILPYLILRGLVNRIASRM